MMIEIRTRIGTAATQKVGIARFEFSPNHRGRADQSSCVRVSPRNYAQRAGITKALRDQLLVCPKAGPYQRAAKAAENSREPSQRGLCSDRAHGKSGVESSLAVRVNTGSIVAEIFLYGGHVAFVDDCDFERISAFSWNLNARGYASRWCILPNGRESTITMHREVMGFQNGDPSIVDHRDGVRLNCRRLNLRVTDFHGNSWNSGRKSSNTSGFKGVYLHKASGRWNARVTVRGRRVSLGYYDDPEEAFELYSLAVHLIHGEFANDGSAVA
jgi:hypothetical protein